MITILALSLLWSPSAEAVAAVVAVRAHRLGTKKHAVYADETAAAVLETSARWRIHPALLLAVAERESAFNAAEVSSAKCVGLMQMAPKTAREFAKVAGLLHYRLTSAADSVRLGATYLAFLRDRYGRWDYALTAYNMGPGLFERQHRHVSAYARQVLTKQRGIGQDLRDQP